MVGTSINWILKISHWLDEIPPLWVTCLIHPENYDTRWHANRSMFHTNYPEFCHYPWYSRPNWFSSLDSLWFMLLYGEMYIYIYNIVIFLVTYGDYNRYLSTEYKQTFLPTTFSASLNGHASRFSEYTESWFIQKRPWSFLQGISWCLMVHGNVFWADHISLTLM